MILTIATLVFFGVILMMMETFVPGWIAGIIGAVCILTSIALTLTSEELNGWPSWGRTILATGIIVFSAISLLVWMKFFAIRFWQKTLTLETHIETPSDNNLPPLDSEGVSITDLRPLGRAEISGKRYDVRCEDGFACAKARIRVSGKEPGNLIVRLIS